MSCPSDNVDQVDQSDFWDPVHGINWDQHRIGWAIAGGCAAITVFITCYTVWKHCRNYRVPREQRQIIRILYMPPIYAVISFFSYRFFRNYTYYSLIYVAYEAVTISAFLLLIIEYVAATAAGHSAESALIRKVKRPLPIPFCCWRYRPTKPYFMYTVKWSVMQYVIVRPAASIAGIICQFYGVLCESEGFNPRFASVYLSAIDFVSITVALYGLLLFYGLTKDELSDRRPLAKFLCIKLIVMFTFYQSFIFTMLEGHVIKATPYWTEANIADGLNALAICIEMVIFAIAMGWAYPASEYTTPGKAEAPTSIWRPLWDSINFMDFVREIFGSLRFYAHVAHEHAHLHHHRSSTSSTAKPNFESAFGLSSSAASSKLLIPGASTSTMNLHGGMDDDHIQLAPYGFTAPGNALGSTSVGAAARGEDSYAQSPVTAGFSPREPHETAYGQLP